jgi:hypothetical protein
VSGRLSDDYKLICEQVGQVLPSLYDHPRVIISRYHDVNARTVGYLPERQVFVLGNVGPSLEGVTPRGILVSTPLELELRLPDPSVVDFDGEFILYHAGRAYEVHIHGMASAVVTVIHGREAEDQTAFDLPDELEVKYPELADVEFELSREHCTFRYYYIDPEKLDSYLELTVRIDLNTEHPEFDYRVVHDPERVRGLLRAYEMLRGEERPEQPGLIRPTGVVVHSLEGTRIAYIAFNLPRDAPIARFADLTSKTFEGVYFSFPNCLHEVPVLDLFAWWFEWKLRWSNVHLPPVKDERDRYCHALLTHPWLAIAPDLLAAASSLSIILPLAYFEDWWFERLKPVAEKPCARGLPGRFLAAVAYYTPVGLLEELLGELVLPHVVRLALTPLEKLLPWPGRVDSDWLVFCSLSCTVAPVVDTLAMQRVAKLTGSPVLTTLAYSLLDWLWAVRSRWFDAHFWLSRALPLTMAVLVEGVRVLPCAVLPPSLAVLLYALQNAGVTLLPRPKVNLDARNQHCLLHALLTPLLEQIIEGIAPV